MPSSPGADSLVCSRWDWILAMVSSGKGGVVWVALRRWIGGEGVVWVLSLVGTPSCG